MKTDTSSELSHHKNQIQQELLAAGDYQADEAETLSELFSLSDFIAQTCERYAGCTEWLLQTSEIDPRAYNRQLQQKLVGVSSEPQLFEVLRQFRHLQMAQIAWLDLAQKQDVEHSLYCVSTLADVLICAAYHWLYSACCERYGVPMAQGKPQPMLILGMGKLGGGELNFSSDIDLIFCYPELGETQGARKSIENQIFFTRLGQKLISALHQITENGQAYRVDMRLRPFGDSGPLVMHFSGLEDYYQSQGREWERYAMVKARVINPEADYSPILYDILKPFVFRRYLDFGSIDSLRNMKRLINQEVRRRGLKDNIKLGAGGIREVEFIVQSFQLIRGGRESELQISSLLKALPALSGLNILTPDDVMELKGNYLFLRKLEHCLQQFTDSQTQTLPQDKLNQQRLTRIMGYADYQQLYQAILLAMQQIHHQFDLLIGDEPDAHVAEPWEELELYWQQQVVVEDLRQYLTAYSADEADTLALLLAEFQQDMQKRSMGQRGQQVLDKLVPQLLWQVLHSDSFDKSSLLQQLFALLKAIYRRTSYLELLNEHPAAVKQLIRLCTASHWIGGQLQRFPILLDDLLDPASLYRVTGLQEYAAELRKDLLRVDESDLELQMETLRQFKLSQQLHVAAADVTGTLPVMKVSDHLTYLAESIIGQVVELSWQQMVQKYGYPQGATDENKQFAVLGYGKLGGLELGYGSDLDLVFVHSCDSNALTQGNKAIESKQFYLKLAQRILHMFNTNTASGQLYEVDMRLRPSGNSGLLVCHIDGFYAYQQQEAWIWEHQALVRSRFIYGDKHLKQLFSQQRQQILVQHRDTQQLMEEVSSMRAKMRMHLDKPDDPGVKIKQGKGGIVDIEFLTQYLVLANSALYPDLTLCSDNVRILQQAVVVGVITEDEGDILTRAYLAFRDFGHRVALVPRQTLELESTQQLQHEVQHIWRRILANEAL